jgi:hypothetical protein
MAGWLGVVSFSRDSAELLQKQGPLSLPAHSSLSYVYIAPLKLCTSAATFSASAAVHVLSTLPSMYGHLVEAADTRASPQKDQAQHLLARCPRHASGLLVP